MGPSDDSSPCPECARLSDAWLEAVVAYGSLVHEVAKCAAEGYSGCEAMLHEAGTARLQVERTREEYDTHCLTHCGKTMRSS